MGDLSNDFIEHCVTNFFVLVEFLTYCSQSAPIFWIMRSHGVFPPFRTIQRVTNGMKLIQKRRLNGDQWTPTQHDPPRIRIPAFIDLTSR